MNETKRKHLKKLMDEMYEATLDARACLEIDGFPEMQDAAEVIKHCAEDIY